MKNKLEKPKFITSHYPTQPVTMQLISWIKAFLYYSRHLPEVNQLCKFLKGLFLATQAKASLQTPDLAVQLLKIK